MQAKVPATSASAALLHQRPCTASLPNSCTTDGPVKRWCATLKHGMLKQHTPPRPCSLHACNACNAQCKIMNTYIDSIARAMIIPCWAGQWTLHCCSCCMAPSCRAWYSFCRCFTCHNHHGLLYHARHESADCLCNLLILSRRHASLEGVSMSCLMRLCSQWLPTVPLLMRLKCLLTAYVSSPLCPGLLKPFQHA